MNFGEYLILGIVMNIKIKLEISQQVIKAS